MTTLAILFDDRPPEWRQLVLCVILRALTLTISWVLIRWKPWLAGLAVMLAAGSAYLIIDRFQRTLRWASAGSGAYSYDTDYHVAVWASAIFPFLMIGLFFRAAREQSRSKPRTV